MKRPTKQFFFAGLVLAVLTGLAMFVFAEVTPISGQCGDNVYWSLDDTSDTLTIYGSGPMDDFVDFNPPWSNFYTDWILNDREIEVIIEDGVTTVGERAFVGLPIIRISLPKTLITIKSNAFYGCDFANVVIPYGVTSIQDYAFYCCYQLTSISIPDSVTKIGDWAFGNSGLLSILIPDSVISIGKGAFWSCIAMTEATISYNLSTISDDLFSNCHSLKSITIPNSVSSIGARAFYSCEKLESVNIPNSVISLGNAAFSKCQSLSSLLIPSSVTTIGNDVFFECIGLSNITIPNGITSLGKGVFNYCLSLKQITIPGSVEYIGVSAFADCESLQNVYYLGSNDDWATIIIDSWNEPLMNASIHFLGSSEDAISGQCGENVFWEYNYNTERLIINGYGEIWDFNDYVSTPWVENDIVDSIKEIIIEEGITKIGQNAFVGCESVYSISLPSTLKIISNNAFKECFDLQIVNLPNGLEMIGNSAFQDCGSLSNLAFPNSLTDIGEMAFNSCGFENIILGESIKRIKNDTFGYCIKLKSIVFNKNLEQINDGALFMCYNLESVTFLNPITEIDENTVPLNVTIYGFINSSADEYAKIFNHTFIPLDVPIHTHTPTTYTQPSTCIVPGYIIITCSECNEQIDMEVLPLAAHQYGEWVTVKEPTTTEKGQRERTCTVCGIAKETEDIPVLEQLLAKDEPSGITVSFDEGTYEEDAVELRVEEVFDGSQYLTQSYGRIDSWNIKTYVNGEEAQPGQPVTVRIPLPEGYDPNNIAVFHVNSKTGQSERIEDVRVEDGYIVFTAASFSVYIVVDESSAVQSEPQQDPNACHWCGKVHNGFFGGIVAFFHRIFARLFGAKY